MDDGYLGHLPIYNIKNLSLSNFAYIIDYTPISTLDKLEILKMKGSCINNISFLEKAKNIKTLKLNYCPNISNISSISKLDKLETLIINKTRIVDISFLERNKNIKHLELCKNHKVRFDINIDTHIKDFSPISKLDKLEILHIEDENIFGLYFLENNKNIINLNGCFYFIILILHLYLN